jgi:hypothetical protein
MSPRDRLAELVAALDLKRSHTRMSGSRVIAIAAPHGRIFATGDDLVLDLNHPALNAGERAIGSALVAAGLITTNLTTGDLVLLRQPIGAEITDLRWLLGLSGRQVPA